jgi:hypothetical protein
MPGGLKAGKWRASSKQAAEGFGLQGGTGSEARTSRSPRQHALRKVGKRFSGG